MRPVFALALAVSVAGVASANPIVPTNGESFLLAYGTGVSPQFQFNSSYGNLGPFAPGPFNPAGGSSAVAVGSGNNAASAAFSHAASNSLVSITGSTAARSTGGQFVGQSSADSTGVISPLFQFGYYVEFTLTEASRVRFAVDGTTSPTGAGEYADFGGRLLDASGNQLFAFGQVALNGTVTGGPGVLLLDLQPGTYFLFGQSQSEVIGSGASSANFTTSLQILSPIPEPLSVVAFGTLLAVGGVVLARRRHARG
jgi:hypothetical protein